jgi:pyruvate dehydrogenase E1 component subunit alpha
MAESRTDTTTGTEMKTNRAAANGQPSAGSAAGEAQSELTTLSREELHDLLRRMLLGRRFEEKAAESYALGKIGGFCHLYIGQEAVGVGALSVLRDDDYVITAYREHVQAMLKGLAPRQIMAELFGRSTGSSGGLGGSMHLYSREHNFLGGWAIVGGQISLATGVGWAIRYRGEDRVCLCLLGEAAVNQGAFHESLNMAELWGLPVVYVVENNHFGMGTAWTRVTAETNIAEKGCAYDVKGEVCDGTRVLAVRDAVRRAVERARRESKPMIIEARCYRFMGHSMSDPVSGVYRTKEELQKEKESDDPIRLFIAELRENDLLTEDEVQEMDADVKREVEDAVKYADESPEPDASQLHAHVYATTPEHGRLFLDARTETGS